MKTKTRTNFRLALLALACGNPVALAGDGFIKQPGLREKVASKTTDIAKPPQSAASQVATEVVIEEPKTTAESAPKSSSPKIVTKQASDTERSEPVSILERSELPAKTVSHSVSEKRLEASQEFSQQFNAPAESLTAERPAASRSTSTPEPKYAPGELQWVARGASLPQTSPQRETLVSESSSSVWNRPLEFENPEFQSRTPEPKIELPQAAVEELEIQAPETEQSRRAVMAALISSQIVGDVGSSDNRDAIAPVDSSPGWQAVGERLTKHLQACESQLKHGAFFSARAEAEQAAVYLMRVLDLASNAYSAEPEWNLAIQALRESEDFTIAQRSTADRGLLKRIIDSHQTDALKNVDASNVSPLVAAQHYQQFAEQHLIAASQGHPWASEVLYSMGRTYQAQADSGDGSADVLRGKAMTFYRAAVAIAPRNSLAANQLGFVLLQLDRPQDARGVLLASLEAEVSAPALENLVEASRRLGDLQTHQWAMENLAIYRQLNPSQPQVPVVTEIDAATFMALSPRHIGPQPQPQQNTAPRVAAGNASPSSSAATLR